MIGDREPVRLVPDPLQQVQRLAGAGQNNRIILSRQPHLLQPLGEPAQGDAAGAAVDTERVQGSAGRGDLRGAAVDNDQAGRVGKTP